MKKLSYLIILTSLVALATGYHLTSIKNIPPVKIVVIDTGYRYNKYSNIKFCDKGHKDFTNTGLKDNVGHGTHVTNTIINNLKLKNYCVVIIKWYDPNFTDINYRVKALPHNIFEYVYNNIPDATVINYSASGKGYSLNEKDILSKLIRRGTAIFVAAGNGEAPTFKGNNLDADCIAFPACYKLKYLNVVGNINTRNEIHKSSNYGEVVTHWEVGVDVIVNNGYNRYAKSTGTSVATAVATAKWLNRNFK